LSILNPIFEGHKQLTVAESLQHQLARDDVVEAHEEAEMDEQIDGDIAPLNFGPERRIRLQILVAVGLHHTLVHFCVWRPELHNF
jgi:hypothetical protein